MENNLPNIYEYTDFRLFLDTYQKARYSYDKEWSRLKLCRRLGLPNTRSYYSDVIKGKKVTSSFVDRFVDIFSFDVDEAHYFRVLVKFNQADSPDDRQLYFEQIISYAKTPKEEVNPDLYEYYTHWYHAIIRGLLDIVDFSDNYDDLLRMVYPQISLQELEDSIALLLRLGMIEKRDNGIYKPTTSLITTGKAMEDELIKEYQIQLLELTKQAVIDVDPRPKAFTTKLMSLSEEGFQQVATRYYKFLDEVSSIIHNDDSASDRLYHLNVQVFPAAMEASSSQSTKLSDK